MSLPETYVAGFHDEEAVRRMPYRRLGTTNMIVSKLGFGGGSLSGLYDEFKESEGIETVREAIKMGINYIDTAPYYGQGRSETVIGKALKGIPRSSYYISTKVGRYTKDWDTMFDYSAKKITDGLDYSLSLLGLEYVDIVVVHDVEFADNKQLMEETLPAVKKLVESGKARYIAISGYPVKTLWEIVKNSAIPIDVVLTYSRDTLIDRTLYDFIPHFKEKGVGIINAAAPAMGILTNAGPPEWHPATEEIKKLCAEAAEYCKKNGVELGKLAVYHTMKNEGTENFLIGNNRKQLLNSNMEVALNGLNSKELEVLDHLYKTYFSLKENLHWEGIEPAKYKQHLTSKQKNK